MAVLLLLLTVVFYWKVLFTNRRSFPWDASDFFYPYLAFVHEELRHFRIPLWDPYVFSGFPIIGDPEGQIFYPPNWLMVLLHPFSPLPYRLVEIQLIAHFFLAGLFMFYLARDFTRDKLSALLGAILFMFSGAMVAHTEHLATIEANAWYPLVLLLARRGLLEGNLYWTIAAGIVFAIENLTGHWQHAVYLGPLVFLYFAYEACAGPLRRQLWPRWIYQLGLIAAVGAGLAMVQILPTYELGNHSIRSQLTYWDVTQGNSPGFLWTLFLPNYFGGINGVPYVKGVEASMNYVFLTVPGCLLALIGLIEMARKRNFFWFGVILVCADLSVGRNGFLAHFLFYIPILNLFRQTPVYFDLANLALCLMAAVGAFALFDPGARQFHRKWLPPALLIALLSAAVLGLALRFAWKIHGWHHMLAVLALTCLVVTALVKNRLALLWAQFAILTLIVFQVFHYSMNQQFNSSRVNPVSSMAYNSVSGRKETLQFLKSDIGNDFRVAAFAESQWNNGPNVWRVPGIYGWNPVQLRRYTDYVRQFTRSDYSVPYGDPDHNIRSAMLDLLGVKYIVALNPNIEAMGLANSTEFERAFSDLDWWVIYRNKKYLSRAWFYPRAYVLPDSAPLLALMNSQWFQARRTLLFSKEDLSSGRSPLAEVLDTIPITLDQIGALSTGRVNPDLDCAEPRRKLMYWMGKGNWIRFDFNGPTEPGRYVLLMEYATAEEQPFLRAEVRQGERKQDTGPVRILRGSRWSCHHTRTAEIGTFEFTPGENHLTLTLGDDASIDLYSLWLVGLPDEQPADPGEFTFQNFRISANHFAFDARLSQQGYVLVNEIDYPGWEATLDGAPAHILRADGIFRALLVPAGTHRIEMRFRPHYLLPGAAVSLFTLAAVILGIMKLRPHKGLPT